MNELVIPRFWGVDVRRGEHGEDGWASGKDNPVGGDIDFGPCVRASDYDALFAKVARLEAALRFVQSCAVQCPACKQYVDAALNQQERK